MKRSWFRSQAKSHLRQENDSHCSPRSTRHIEARVTSGWLGVTIVCSSRKHAYLYVLASLNYQQEKKTGSARQNSTKHDLFNWSRSFDSKCIEVMSWDNKPRPINRLKSYCNYFLINGKYIRQFIRFVI